jgi:hypothetical protein
VRKRCSQTIVPESQVVGHIYFSNHFIFPLKTAQSLKGLIDFISRNSELFMLEAFESDKDVTM